jgi:hypothetical protein
MRGRTDLPCVVFSLFRLEILNRHRHFVRRALSRRDGISSSFSYKYIYIIVGCVFGVSLLLGIVRRMRRRATPQPAPYVPPPVQQVPPQTPWGHNLSPPAQPTPAYPITQPPMAAYPNTAPFASGSPASHPHGSFGPPGPPGQFGFPHAAPMNQPLSPYAPPAGPPPMTQQNHTSTYPPPARPPASPPAVLDPRLAPWGRSHEEAGRDQPGSGRNVLRRPERREERDGSRPIPSSGVNTSSRGEQPSRGHATSVMTGDLNTASSSNPVAPPSPPAFAPTFRESMVVAPNGELVLSLDGSHPSSAEAREEQQRAFSFYTRPSYASTSGETPKSGVDGGPEPLDYVERGHDAQPPGNPAPTTEAAPSQAPPPYVA